MNETVGCLVFPDKAIAVVMLVTKARTSSAPVVNEGVIATCSVGAVVYRKCEGTVVSAWFLIYSTAPVAERAPAGSEIPF